MPKKCIICDKEAVYSIKDTSDYYCEECAEENFDDVSCLTKIDEKPDEIILDQLKEVIGEKKNDEVKQEESNDKK